MKLIMSQFLSLSACCLILLTGDQSEGADAGEGGDVQVHPLQIGGELNDAVNPLPEAPQALEAVPHRAVTEDQLPCLWVRSEK